MTKIVILTGAGISAESGLGTFRDEGGLWSQYDLDEVATPQGFAKNPRLVLDFYNARRANARQSSPNAAHAALAKLEDAIGADLTLVTQNIDGLHEAAGSKAVIHMHGEIEQALCASCGHRWLAPDKMAPADLCPACNAPSTRPDIVWFGEMPYHMDQIYAALEAADLFVSIGTSGEVYPAAGFVDVAQSAGVKTLEINLEPTDRPGLFDDVIVGPATQTVPAWVTSIVS